MKNKNIHAVQLGRLGGKSKSPAKQEASRRNGKLGGCPINPNSARQKKMRKDLTKAKRLAILEVDKTSQPLSKEERQ